MAYIPKYFTVNPLLDTFLVKTRFFLLDIKRVVDECTLTITDDDFKNLPSWSKFHKYPIKAKGWYIHLIQAIFNGQHNFNEVHSDLIINETNILKNVIEIKPRRRVVMIFMGDNIMIKNLNAIGYLNKEALPEWEHIILHGQLTNQYKAEKLVKDKLEELDRKGFTEKPVMILSAKMGQRSFSIKEITELYLAYDGGSRGTTIQKISRTLTIDFSNKDKIGNIFSLSFDSNRDDKIDGHVIEAALNMVKKSGIDFREALRMILSSIDIYSSTQIGVQFINNDQFIEDAMSRGSVSRAIGITANLYGLPKETLQAIAAGNADYKKDEILDAATKGKTTAKKKKPMITDFPEKPEKELAGQELTLMHQARQVIITLIEEFGHIFIATKTTNCADAIQKMKDEKWDDAIFSEHGLTLDLIDFLIIKEKRVRPEWIEALHNKEIIKIQGNTK